jgi:hypothetical protein
MLFSETGVVTTTNTIGPDTGGDGGGGIVRVVNDKIIDIAELVAITVNADSNGDNMGCVAPAGKVQLVASIDAPRRRFVCGGGRFDTNTTMAPYTCEPCANGTATQTLAVGAMACDTCPVRAFAELGAINCSPCVVGTFGVSRGQSSCRKCAVGTFVAQEGQLSCVACPADSFSDSTGAAVCKSCPAGTYTECASFTSDAICKSPCEWHVGRCVTRQCATCTDAKRPDCSRWDKFTPEYSTVT